MSKWKQLIDTLRNALALAEAEPEPVAPTHTRAIASAQLLSQVRDYVDELNMSAYRVDPNMGGTYIDWDQYFQVLDLYYDDDGSLFLLGQQKGKLFRVPVEVIDDAVSFGEMLPLSLTAERSMNAITVTRDAATGERRWFMIASSAVLNRVNEIDSTQLFDNFIRRARQTEKYPILSFYHNKNQIQLGRATWLAREGYLYLAAGLFADTEDAITCANTLERDGDLWGASIGYAPLVEPDFVEIAKGVTIPVFTDGINEEISIVLERDAADRFTRTTTEEVKRTMRKNEKDALVKMFGQARADEIENTIDGTNRTIEESELVRRAGDVTAPLTAPHVTALPPAPEPAAAVTAPVAEPIETVTAEPVAVQDATPGLEVVAVPVAESQREVELDEETLAALADALTSHPSIQQLQTSLAQLGAQVAQLLPQVSQLQDSERTHAVQVDERLALLEQDDAQKQAQWTQDLPNPLARTRLTFRPRDARPAVDPKTQPAADMGQVANATLATLKTRRPGR